MRNDFLVEDDNRVIRTSAYESHTGNLAQRPTHLLSRILVVDVMMTTNSHSLSKIGFWV